MHSVVLALVIADIALPPARRGSVPPQRLSCQLGCMARESSCRIGGLWPARWNLVKLAQSIRPPLWASYVNQNNAVEAVDQVRSRIDGLRDGLLDLHRMAAEVINEEYGDRPTREEPIWELAKMLASEMLEFADGLRAAFHTVEELEALAGADWTKSNGITSLHFLCPFFQELWSYVYFNVGRNVGSAGPPAPPNITFSPS